MQFYRPMLKQALSITWRFKYLWFFGLFAALLGNGGAFNLGTQNFYKVENQGVFLSDLKQFVTNFSLGSVDFKQAFDLFDFWGIVLFLIIIAIAIFLLWLSISSQGGLVYGIKQVLKSKECSFSQALKKGSSKFWPIFILNLLLSVVLIIIWAVLSLPFIVMYLASQSMIWQNVVVVLAFIVLVPAAVILALVVVYSIMYVVNEDQHIAKALVSAWQLFKKNWIVSLEVALLLFLINILSGLLLIVLVVFVSLPFLMLGMLASYVASLSFLWLVIILGILTFIVLMFLYAAVINTFQTSVWVILFERIKNGTVFSKVLRWGVALTGGKKEEVSN